MMKKAQAQIITTVLIILLVLAAIVIVWQVVSGTIEEGGETIEEQSSCIGTTMSVVNIVGDCDTTSAGGCTATDPTGVPYSDCDAEVQLGCTFVSFTPTDITIQRESGGATEDTGWKILLDGVSATSSATDGSENLGQLESFADDISTYTSAPDENSEITVSAMIEGVACGASVAKTATDF